MQTGLSKSRSTRMHSVMRRLEYKTAIITGATMGIGESIARRFGDEGARLVLVARGRERGEALEREFAGRARFVAGSVCDRGVADAAVAAANEFGGVDVLVNNAGVDFTGHLLETDETEARRVLETNFFGASLDARTRGSGVTPKRWWLDSQCDLSACVNRRANNERLRCFQGCATCPDSVRRR